MDSEDSKLEPLAYYERKHARKAPIPNGTGFSRQQVITAFQDAFELIGGVPRLALWGHDNPGEFFKLYAKLLPSAAQQTQITAEKATIHFHLAPSPLDELPAHMEVSEGALEAVPLEATPIEGEVEKEE